MNEWDVRLLAIVNRAVWKAQEENRRNGVPNVYVVNGTIVWQLPDGTITTVDPLRQSAASSSPGIRYGLAKGKYRLARDIDAGNAEILQFFQGGEPCNTHQERFQLESASHEQARTNSFKN